MRNIQRLSFHEFSEVLMQKKRRPQSKLNHVVLRCSSRITPQDPAKIKSQY